MTDDARARVRDYVFRAGTRRGTGRRVPSVSGACSRRCQERGSRGGRVGGVLTGARWQDRVMRTFAVIYEPAGDGTISAHSPQVPGVVASGRTQREAEEGWHEAIELYREAVASGEGPASS